MKVGVEARRAWIETPNLFHYHVRLALPMQAAATHDSATGAGKLSRKSATIVEPQDPSHRQEKMNFLPRTSSHHSSIFI